MSQLVFVMDVTTIRWIRLANGQSGENHSPGECLSYLWWQYLGTKGVVITITESRIDHWFGEEDSPDIKTRRKWIFYLPVGAESPVRNDQLTPTRRKRCQKMALQGERSAPHTCLTRSEGSDGRNTTLLGRLSQGFECRRASAKCAVKTEGPESGPYAFLPSDSCASGLR